MQEITIKLDNEKIQALTNIKRALKCLSPHEEAVTDSLAISFALMDSKKIVKRIMLQKKVMDMIGQ